MPATLTSKRTDRHGMVYQAADDGLAYVAEEGTGHLYSFSFDRIDGYRGETVAQMHLDKARRVRFRLEGRHVTRVWL